MKKTFFMGTILTYLLFSCLHSEPTIQAVTNDELIKKAALEIISVSKYCTLISTGNDGFPNARIMDPFPPDRNWVIWMGTNAYSRKVKEILTNKKITLFYESEGSDGYVSLKGTGYINNEQENKIKYFKSGWKEFYPDDRTNFTLIKFVTEKLEIVSYKKGLLGEKRTWEAPSILFEN